MDDDQVVGDKESTPRRPWTHRLLHTVGEVLLSFLLAAGVLMLAMKLACSQKYACQDMNAIIYFIPFLIVTIVIWSGYLALCNKLRDRLPARKKLDIAVFIITAMLWLALFLIK